MAIKRKEKEIYYSLDRILKENADYNVIFGERSNGKTYAVLKYALEQYVKNGSQLAIVRRYRDDFTGKRGDQIFAGLVNNEVILKLTNGEWSGVRYYSSRWYLCKYDEKLGKQVMDSEAFAYGFALNTWEHDKMPSYPKIRIIFFDEFITRDFYLDQEFVLFANVVSTVARDRGDIKIFMCGNTVNKYNPYFVEMGLKEVKKMKQGDLQVYTYGESELKVAVEYSYFKQKKKKSDKYFAFNNPKLQMITGGAWEIALYPHLPYKYKPKDVYFTFFIEYDNEMIQGELINVNDTNFLYMHRKTTELKNTDRDIIYSQKFDPRPNWRRRLTKPKYKWEQKIKFFFDNEKVFYQDNDVGELVRNYLNWSDTHENFA